MIAHITVERITEVRRELIAVRTRHQLVLDPDDADVAVHDLLQLFMQEIGIGAGLAAQNFGRPAHAGGDLIVASDPGLGSTFTIRLPLRSLNEPDPLATTPHGTPLEPPDED